MPHGSAKGAAVSFAEGRLAAEAAEAVQQRQAARRVAEHSRDADDCLDLLSMLGLSGLAPRSAPLPARPLDEQFATVTLPEALGVFRSIEGARR
ncbi:hypothetical protein BBK82_34685 [Lentzea guizhouensis]|uniref:Uncharacterized protein n=1 Tax=Lentzea guizhouensis TaxID=1586287 RepID=A0A1B2HRT3_9PSEU|nr:hypothetical protein BBK82_34685 [Lentzea guizhouensis]